MYTPLIYVCTLLVCVQLCCSLNSVSIRPLVQFTAESPVRTKLSMLPVDQISSSFDISHALGIIPLCLEATSKTTVINDPTAGMTPEEITNYMSNVGGGMCGYPEPVRAAVGVGLNLSLIVFGLFTVSYVVLGGIKFALEKNVEDLVKQTINSSSGKARVELLAAAQKSGINMGSGLFQQQQQQSMLDGDDDSKGGRGSGGGLNANSNRKDGANRDQRRIQSKLRKQQE